MGRYISVSYHIQSDISLSRLLAPIFTTSFFRPVGVGGFQVTQQGNRWFLGGYALEDFVSFFMRRGNRRTLSIDYASTRDDLEQQYLTSIADIITQGKDISGNLSPFEIQVPGVHVTRIPSMSLNTSILDAANQWLTSFPRGEIYFYGAIQLSIQSDMHQYLERAFRYFYYYNDKLIYAPFLFIKAMFSPFDSDQIDITLYSSSQVWLESAKALSGRVDQIEADTNLDHLSIFAQSIAPSEMAKLKLTELDIGEGLFYEERERIQKAFSKLPRLT